MNLTKSLVVVHSEGRELQKVSGMQHSCPPEFFHPTTFHQKCGKMKTSAPPHILKLRLGESKGMLPVKYFHSNNPSVTK